MAQSGRPGPVVIDIPMNFQKAKINPKKLRGFKQLNEKKNNEYLKKQIEKIKKFITKSKRPVILIGGGIKISKSEKILDKLLKNCLYQL